MALSVLARRRAVNARSAMHVNLAKAAARCASSTSAAATPSPSPNIAAAAAAPKKKRSAAAAPPADKTTMSPMRAFFFGELSSFAKHCMPFPKALDGEQVDTLRALVDPVEHFFGSVDSTKIDREETISEGVMHGLRDMGLFGLQISEELGGLGLSNTAFARVIECMTDPSIAVTLLAHQSIGLKGILMFGTPAQKAAYLPKLATGEHVAAFVLTEPGTGSDAASIKLSATPTPDGKGYALNGQKMWISNGGIAQVCAVGWWGGVGLRSLWVAVAHHTPLVLLCNLAHHPP